MLLRHLSMDLMKRVHGNYRFVISFNLGLILLGVAGIITPSMSALLHDSSTLAIGLKSMTNLLPEERAGRGIRSLDTLAVQLYGELLAHVIVLFVNERACHITQIVITRLSHMPYSIARSKVLPAVEVAAFSARRVSFNSCKAVR